MKYKMLLHSSDNIYYIVIYIIIINNNNNNGEKIEKHTNLNNFKKIVTNIQTDDEIIIF